MKEPVETSSQNETPNQGGKGQDKGVVPEDTHKLVYIICCWLGIGMLLPWNFYYNADGYWKYKFRNIHNETQMTSMQVFWGSNLSIVSMTPNFLFLMINVFVGHRMRIKPRLYATLLFNIILFIISLSFTQVNTDPWQKGFYWTTLTFAILFNMNDAIFQGAFAALIGRFPAKYMSSLAQGQAIGGTVASGITVIFMALGSSDINVALFSFSFATVFLTSAFFLYIYVSKQPFYLYYAPSEDDIGQDGEASKVDYRHILSHTWQLLLSIFLNYFVTLGVFPAIPVLAVSSGDSPTWSKYFIPVGCFLIFNLTDLLGRMMAAFTRWPGPTTRGSTITLIMVLLRLAFIPLFMFCNVRPDHRVNSHIYFPSDVAYLIINTAFGISNGYITNVCMMNTPKMVADEKQQSVAASIMVFLLVGGLFAGSAFSRLWVLLL